MRLLGLVVSESPQTSKKPSPTHPQDFLRCAETGAGTWEGGSGRRQQERAGQAVQAIWAWTSQGLS